MHGAVRIGDDPGGLDDPPLTAGLDDLLLPQLQLGVFTADCLVGQQLGELRLISGEGAGNLHLDDPVLADGPDLVGSGESDARPLQCAVQLSGVALHRGDHVTVGDDIGGAGRGGACNQSDGQGGSQQKDDDAAPLG